MHLRGYVASIAVGATFLACSSDPDPDKKDLDASAVTASRDTGTRGDGSSIKRVDGGGLGTLPVGADSPACTANLPFHPPGCPCGDKDEVTSCWSGPPGNRNRGKCHDGKQQCALGGEFRTWEACTGEELDCGETPDAGTPEDCECVPGTKILCSEDCEQFIICSLTGTKTCQPDGTWGPCTEQFLAGLEGVIGCKNLYFKCLFDYEGIYVGDCNSTFTCGHPPGLPPIGEPPVQDAGTPDAGPTGPVIQ